MSKYLSLLVGAILLLLLAAVAIPCLVNSKDSANEASAAATTRRLTTAEIEYRSTHGRYADMKSLAGPEDCTKPISASACLIDSMVANSSPASPRNDYYFTAQLGPSPGTFVVAALPVKFPHQSFCATEDGVLHSDGLKSSSGTPSYADCKSLPALAT